MDRVKSLRYNEKDYFWINDLTPRMVMHPFKPEMNGQDLSTYKDPTGKLFFVVMADLCKSEGGGLVPYMWPKPGSDKPVPKFSFVKLFKPWGWIIGSGVYVDELEAQLASLRNTILIVIAGVLLLAGTIGILFGRRHRKGYEAADRRSREVGSG